MKSTSIASYLLSTIHIPSYLTVICLIATITIASDDLRFEYLIPLVALTCFAVVGRGQVRGAAGKSLFYAFAMLIIVQLGGQLHSITYTSITNTLAIACVFLLIYTVSETGLTYRRETIVIMFACVLVVMVIFYGSYASNRNSLSAYFLFFNLLLVALFILGRRTETQYRSFRDVFIPLLCGIGSVVVFSFLSSARSSLLAGTVIIGFYVVFYFINAGPKTYRALFVATVFITVVGLVFYTNITSFSWYGFVDQYSYSIFGKHIDSSRPELWQRSLAQLNDWSYIVGLGASTVHPPGYDGSFHNSFLQLLMQSGIVGLLCLIWVFWIIWKNVSCIEDRAIRSLFFAGFIGIIVFSCFECCLLQNKLFIGMLQWSFLAVGLNVSHVVRQQYPRSLAHTLFPSLQVR